jgi:hypothetical protein
MPMAISEGIQTALSTNATLITLLGGTVIYQSRAPQESQTPYVVYFISGGGENNDSPKDTVDEFYTVLGVTSNNGALAGSISDEIRNALHEAELTFSGNWKHIRCNREQKLWFTEHAERATFYSAGGVYRVRAANEP